MLMQRLLAFPMAALMVVVMATAAFAHSVIPISPPVRPGNPPDIRLRSLSVNALVNDDVARVRIDQTFVNESRFPAEGTYLFPLPQGATVSSFQMFVDGTAYTAEVLDSKRARDIYEEIVRRNRDPALLEYMGQGLLQARVFPVPPGAERKIRVEYDQVLSREAGLAELAVPIGREPVPSVAVNVELRGVGGGTVYSPTHDVVIARSADGTARVSYAGNAAHGDFRLFFGTPTGSAPGISLLSYKAAGEDGYFLMLETPPAATHTEVVSQDVVLVIDLSGSMAGEKFDQAKGAAIQLLGSLNSDDRFAVIGFHSGTTAYADTLRGAGEASQAMEWVGDLRLGGATNIADAMAAAQRLAAKDTMRPQIILLITDGQPTAGEQDPDRIAQGVSARVTPSQRIFTFGVGFDVNTRLLDALSQDNRGRSDYVKPGENIEAAVAGLWRKIGQPVLADLQLRWTGVQVEEVFPRPVPDLFLGSQLVLMGRYRKGATAALTISGKVNGQTKTYRFDDLRFTERDTARDYIPRLWANRKVGYLLSEIRLRGTNKEMVDEVVSLAQRFAIVTPYTSFFVNEPNQPSPPAGAAQSGVSTHGPKAEAPAAQVASAMKSTPSSGQAAVEAAAVVGQMRDAKSLSQTQTGGTEAGQIRTAGDKSFVRKGTVWTDTAYQGGEVIHLKLGSDKYLDLIRTRPDLARYFSVGSPLIVVDGTHNYGVDLEGSAETTETISAEAPSVGSRSMEASTEAEIPWPTVGGGLLLLVGGALLVYRRRTH